MSTFLHYDSLEISKEWFQYGKENYKGQKAPEIAFRFIAYWIAFNGFYAQCSTKYSTEQEDIETFIKKNIGAFSNLFDFENDRELRIFREYPVFKNDREPNWNGDYLDPNNADKDVQRYQRFMNPRMSECERLQALMLTIYQVRCNMFHGQKGTEPSRNFNLVDASQQVLEKILECLL